MRRKSGCPAIWAGLLGGFSWLVPGTAQALALFGDGTAPFAEAVPPFAIGCVTGAALTGAVVAVVGHAHHDEVADREVRQASRSAVSHEQPPAAAPVAHGRHARVNWENTGNIRVQAVPSSNAVHFAAAKPAATRVEAVPAAAPKAIHAAHDYEDIAENYVRRQTLSERMHARAEGVRAVLEERMKADMMDGLPVIERADGTVGDVGTTWWEDALEESRVSPATPFYASESQDDVSFGIHKPVPKVPVFDANDSVTFEKIDVINPDMPSQAAMDASRASLIASRLSNIDYGVYPEERTVPTSGDASSDMWASALAALEERSVAPVEEVEAIIGNMDSLDEPDGLEADTSFIPFRMPAGHPEVVDTETYVDYLIDQEFSQNHSESARHSSREFLHVIEGGSHKMRHLARRQAQEA